jgi:hypothetical protein
MSELFDRAGRRRSPAAMPGFHASRPPHNKGLRYPADPPKVEEIIAVMRAAGEDGHGARLRGLIVILWRAGLRIHEALALAEGDLDPRRGSVLVRRGKGGRRREVHGRSSPGSSCESNFPSGRCSACSPARRVAASGPAPPDQSFATPPRRPAFAAASRRTNFATRTRSSWRAKAYRSS